MKFKLIKEWFNNYTKIFDKGFVGKINPIKYKIEHSKIVAKEIFDIAKHSGLKNNDLVVARAIGLLHDIGRFEQYAKYKTFYDKKSENHAHLGVEILENNSVLKYFLEKDKYVILRAIEYHNSKKLPSGLNEREKMFAQLARDADKIDIFSIVIKYYKNMPLTRSEMVDFNLVDSPKISAKVIKDLLSGKATNYNDLKTLNDLRIIQIGWVYDINFPRTFEIISERKYIDKIYSFLPNIPVVNRIYNDAKKHIERNK
ncbi:MAG: HD domain-containing protein [Elusimicrobia bacterium]|nr:HD domain-containing protein [Candidatus Liberimonas magnetica]